MTTESLKECKRKDGEKSPSEFYLDVIRLNEMKLSIDFSEEYVIMITTKEKQSERKVMSMI